MKFPGYFVYFIATTLIAAPNEVHMTYYDSGAIKESIAATLRPDGKSGAIMKHFYPDGTLKLEIPIVNGGNVLGYAADGVGQELLPERKDGVLSGMEAGKAEWGVRVVLSGWICPGTGGVQRRRIQDIRTLHTVEKKLAPEPCLVVETAKLRVTLSQDVVLHVDSYHDTGAHIGWIFGYKLVGKEWKKGFEQGRGDNIESRATKTISVPFKELSPGEWQFTVTSTVRGPGFFTEARSTSITIEPAADRKSP